MSETNNAQLVTTKLDESHVQDVMERIAAGDHYKDIAQTYGCSLWQLFKLISLPKYHTEFKEAKEFAAQVLVDEAERVLAAAKGDYKLLAVATQLAHHYRWKASMIYGRQYSQRKVIVEEIGDSTKKSVTIKIIEDEDTTTFEAD